MTESAIVAVIIIMIVVVGIIAHLDHVTTFQPTYKSVEAQNNPCTWCSGSGESHENDGPGLYYTETCFMCKGTGVGYKKKE